METARVLTDGSGQTVSIPQAYRFAEPMRLISGDAALSQYTPLVVRI